jgi:DNA-binding transcriptional ArsR family regulator
MGKKYVMLDLDDEKLSILADVLSNKTAKKILEYIAEKEISETEIARDLKLPANTVNYNIKNLLNSGLIEIAKDYFWSVKGRKILKYRVANKKIVISPKSSKNAVGVLSALLLTGIATFAIKIYSSSYYTQVGSDSFAKTAVDSSIASGTSEGARLVAESGTQNAVNLSLQMPEIWIWFLLGGICALIFYMMLNWRRL